MYLLSDILKVIYLRHRVSTIILYYLEQKGRFKLKIFSLHILGEFFYHKPGYITGNIKNVMLYYFKKIVCMTYFIFFHNINISTHI